MEINDINAIESANWQRRCGELDDLNAALAAELDRQRPVIDAAVEWWRKVDRVPIGDVVERLILAVNAFKAKDKVKVMDDNKFEIAVKAPETVVETESETDVRMKAEVTYCNSGGRNLSGITGYEAGWKAAKAYYEGGNV